MQDDFATLGLSAALLEVLAAIPFERPTPIQARAIPPALAGRDLIAQSRTGSGKTAAFALPLLQGIELGRREPQALVICPTRELSAQVVREIRGLGRALPGLVVLELIGGQPRRAQAESLQRGAHIAVGTPGRIADHLKRGALAPGGVRALVLDEADRMLDMGFGEDVRRIVSALPAERRTALFSATLPPEIEELGRGLLRDPRRIEAEDARDAEEPPAAIRQHWVQCAPDARPAALCSILEQHPHESALVFCNFKATVAELTASLRQAGLSADRLDGDLDQHQRNAVLARLRNGSLRMLIATDVAGRGLDVEGLDLVVNYELPPTPEAYVHRIGRTGRAGAPGLAISISPRADDERLLAAAAHTGQPIPELSVPPGRGSVAQRLAALARPAAMDTLQISGGRKHKLRAGDILGALTGGPDGLPGGHIGRIELHDTVTFVAVRRASTQRALAQLAEGRIKGKRFRARRFD